MTPLERAKAIVAHGDNIAYPSRASAQYVRLVMRELVDHVEILEMAIAMDESFKPPAPKVPEGHERCSSCGRLFKFGETCSFGGCPCGGDV